MIWPVLEPFDTISPLTERRQQPLDKTPDGRQHRGRTSTMEPADILGPAAASHIPIIADVLDGIGEHKYEFMSPGEFAIVAKDDWLEGQRIYWLEILYRAHFAAATSLIRTARWVDAMLALSDNPNLTAFSSGYRGCLEAAADSYHTFRFVPGMLADFHTVIRAALAKTIEQPTLFKDLEDALIHFTHAGYVAKGEQVDPAVRAKQTTDYLKSLTTESVDVMGCYREVCDITHPGIGSVRCYADTFQTKTGSGYRLRFDRDAAQIRAFCREYEPVTRRMMFFSVVAPVMTLRLLNDFGIEAINTPAVMRVVPDTNPAWIPVGARLKHNAPPHAKSVEIPEDESTPPVGS